MNTPNLPVGDPEMQAIIALCHHETYMSHSPYCEACEFRKHAAIEHLRVTISGVIESLSEDK